MTLAWPRVLVCLVTAFALSVLAPRDASAQESPYSPPSGWRPGQPAPDGFVVKKSKLGKALVIAGSVSLGVGYAPMLSFGLGGEVICASWPSASGSDRAQCAGVFAQAFIPLAGPFLLFAEGEGLKNGTFGQVFLVCGILQSAGAVSLASGLVLDAMAAPKLVPNLRVNEHGGIRVHVTPMIGGRVNGAMLVGSF